jgi:hypothetical protein
MVNSVTRDLIEFDCSSTQDTYRTVLKCNCNHESGVGQELCSRKLSCELLTAMLLLKMLDWDLKQWLLFLHLTFFVIHRNFICCVRATSGRMTWNMNRYGYGRKRSWPI